MTVFSKLKSFLGLETPSRSKVFILYLEYSDEHRKSGMEVLKGFASRVFPDQPKDFVIIDNSKNDDAHVKTEDNAHCMAGDNSTREFSGLDRGIDWVLKNAAPEPDSVFLMVNDTFHRSYGTEYLNLFEPRSVRRSLEAGMLVGYVDAFPEDVQLFGLSVQSWIRTSLILARFRELKELLPLTIPASNAEVFDFAHYQGFFKEPSPLSANYRKFLKTWLFGENSDGMFQEEWHSQKSLSRENFESFVGKTRSILCEHYFSARARKLGIAIFNVRAPEK